MNNKKTLIKIKFHYLINKNIIKIKINNFLKINHLNK
jgi:hypothetical protein